jgi:hypothetical protein
MPKLDLARAELEVAECWAPWLAWVLKGWSGQQLAIAIDATPLGAALCCAGHQRGLSRLPCQRRPRMPVGHGLRAWIEQGFKRYPSAVAGNGNTPAWRILRAERRWLALALATWWLLEVKWRGRSSPSDRDVTARARCRPAPRKGLAIDRCLSPRMEPDHGGITHASTPTDGAWRGQRQLEFPAQKSNCR